MNKIINEDIRTILDGNMAWNEFGGKSILVTGAYGILASYLVYTLIELNKTTLFHNPCKIFALGRNIEKAREKFGADFNSKINFINQDVCETIDSALNLDFIIHAASPASPKYYAKQPVDVMLPNVLGTLNLLNYCKHNSKCRLLYISTSEVYVKQNQNNEYLYENLMGSADPATLRSCYCESKRAGETLCVSYKQQYGIDCVIVRPFHSYGPGMPLDDGRVFADFVNNIVSNENIVLKSDGLAVRAFCYLTDVTKGFFTVLLKGQNGEAYNLGNPSAAISVKDLALALVKLFPQKKLQVIFDYQANSGTLQSQVQKSLPDIEKIKKLGWNPSVGIEEGFQRTILSYNEGE